MKILYLDDQEYRHEMFRKMIGKEPYVGMYPHADIISCYDASEAMVRLEQEVIEMASLDHDLGSTLTGMDVVDFICKMPPEKRPKEIRIHTANMTRGREMVARLVDAGHSNVYQDSLTGW